MIKENKEKQREKNGNSSVIKSEIPGVSVSQTPETTIKEEPGQEPRLSESDEGESSCKKNGLRVSGSSTPSSTNICAHTDLKPAVIGSSNVGTVGSNRTSASSQGSGDLCLPDSAPEVKSEDVSLPENPPPCASIKTEINGNSNHEFPNSAGANTTATGDPCESVLPMGLPLPTSSGPPPNGVQPLPSNVINKQPGTMEAQYMQQQSQIFVFSTNLANKSAEAVLQGQFPSIIAYHCAQPGTKKYLEKHPLKMNQFSRQNPAQWLNSLAQMKQKGGPGMMKGLPAGFQGDMGTSPGLWNQSNSGGNNNSTSNIPSTNNSNNSNSCNSSLMSNISPVASGGGALIPPCSSNIIPGCSASSLPGTIKTPGIDSPCLMSGSPNSNAILPGSLGTHSPSLPASNTPLLPGAPDMAGSPVMNHGNIAQPSLTGVKVPDENLTPQQRQHREEQLATLRKMQQMLFPEHSPLPEGGNMGATPEGLVMHGLGPVLNMGPIPGPGPGSGAGPGPGPGPGPGGGVAPGPGSVPGPGTLIAQKNMMGGVGGPNSMTPTSAAAQIEWQKLQHQFYEERKKKTSSNMVVGSSASGIGSPVGPPTPSSVGGNVTPRLPAQTAGNQCALSGATSNAGSRTQGPPPPYHQTTRSASVPTAMSSPNPGSPNNPTSNLSLPSPRATSALNSPSDSNRSQFGIGGGSNSSSGRIIGPGPSPTGVLNTSLDSPTSSRPLHPSNPSTPVSTHLSPSAPRKDGVQNGADFSGIPQSSSSQPIGASGANHQPPVDGMFCRTLQSLAQQKQQQQLPNTSVKEPNLMPVPSPQQIQYLNAFEGQELTIQKQPNTSLKETNLQSPSVPPSGLDGNMSSSGSDLNSRLSGPATPLTPTSVEFGSRCPPGDVNRFPISSPHTPGSEGKSQTPTQPSQPQTSVQQQPQTPQQRPPSQQSSQQPTQQSSQQTLQPASQQASQQTSQPTSQQASLQSSQQTSPQGSQQTSPSASQQQLQPTGSPAQQSSQPPPQGLQQQQSQTSPPHSQQQQPQTPRGSGPSPQSQGSRTPGLETAVKTPTSEVGARFLTSSPQMGDSACQPRFSNSAASATTSPALGSQNQNFLQQTPQSMSSIKSQFLEASPSSNVSAPVDASPTSSGNFPCLRSENVPLNPNGNGGVPCSGKMAHFDPITSMAQMSQQLTSSVANSPGSQAPTLMNNVPGGSCSSGMMPFNTPGMHTLQMNEMGNCPGMPDSQAPGAMVNPLAGGPGNQGGPGSFVTIPLQNVPPHSYSPSSSIANMVPCTGTVSTTSCMNQPIAHPNSSGSPKPGNLLMGMGPPRGSSPYAPSPVPQRVMGRPPGPSPYNGANVQVKASAPNTIQYLPAKPQTGTSGPRGPPSLDFLQRFANPLSNLDSKVPTHNLQYFPNNGQPSPVSVGGLNVPMNRPNGLMSGMNSQMGMSGPNCSVGGHVGNPMNNLNGPIMGPNGQIVGMNLPMSGGMVMGPGGPGLGVVPLRGGIRPGGMMRMQQIGGGMFGVPSSAGQPVGGDQMFGGGPPQNMGGGGPNTQVFGPNSKVSPMGLGGAPDASQPLPPSMGQANNFKNPPFIATSDPNYAQQFHNFQQQLYATNTRSQMSNQNIGPNQPFFVPK